MAAPLHSHRDLKVFQKSFDAAMELFTHSKMFPNEEKFSLTDQVRRSSRSVSTNIAEAWRKRRYTAAFISKLSDAEGEAAETQVWIQFAVKCGCINREVAAPLYTLYEEILKILVAMINHLQSWIIGSGNARR